MKRSKSVVEEEDRGRRWRKRKMEVEEEDGGRGEQKVKGSG